VCLPGRLCVAGCGAGLTRACDGSCVVDTLGDGTCDAALSCALTSKDDGDCCPTNYRADCNGSCRPKTWFGDGACDSWMNCALTGWDDGDCVAPQ